MLKLHILVTREQAYKGELQQDTVGSLNFLPKCLNIKALEEMLQTEPSKQTENSSTINWEKKKKTREMQMTSLKAEEFILTWLIYL